MTGALDLPEGLVTELDRWGERFRIAVNAWMADSQVRPHPDDIDWGGLLTQRAAFRDFTTPGRVSCGGATRLLPCADGWVAVSLARPDDVDLLPAWAGLLGLGVSDGDADPWQLVTRAVAASRGAELATTADVLGLPVGVLGERVDDGTDGVDRTVVGSVESPERGDALHGRPVRVLDLSHLWAGPLCAWLLQQAGALVTKVESATRPDGARVGDPDLHLALNGSKQHETIDLTTTDGVGTLRRLIRDADVVVESSRPRALEHLGIAAADELARPEGPTAWVSITGHGRASNRVGFGDDAAVAGGLVVMAEDGPLFCGDAIADPLTGIVAASVAAEAIARRERVLLDVAMSGVAASFAGRLPSITAIAGERVTR